MRNKNRKTKRKKLKYQNNDPNQFTVHQLSKEKYLRLIGAVGVTKKTKTHLDKHLIVCNPKFKQQKFQGSIRNHISNILLRWDVLVNYDFIAVYIPQYKKFTIMKSRFGPVDDTTFDSVEEVREHIFVEML